MTTASPSLSPVIAARPAHLSARSRLVILAFGLSMLLTGLGSRVLTRHETLAAQPAREMLQLGHWIIPTIAGTPRLLKPPTMSWTIAASMALFGRDAEWVARCLRSWPPSQQHC